MMLHTQLQHLPHDTFKFYLKCRDKFFRDATTQASPSMLKHLSSSYTMGTSGLPDIYTQGPRAYISGEP